LESIPENGEIPDLVLQSTAITNNDSCLATTETSRNRRELSYMDMTAQILFVVRGEKNKYLQFIIKKNSSDF
jgi:hypothetical protein